MGTGRIAGAVLLPALALACSSRTDQAARNRIFSPEEPPSDVQRAAEPIQVDDAGTDGAVWSRIWRMERLEVTHRIGPHKAHATIHFKWSRAGRVVELTEEQSFETNAEGEFDAIDTNDQDSGFEYVWAGGKAYARSRYGSFHPRRTDRAQQDVVREDATSGLRTVFGLLRREAHGSPAGTHDAAGRPATRLLLSLGNSWGPEAPADMFHPTYGLAREPGKDALHPGPDEDTARRLELDTREQPERLSGEIEVDPSGVILQAVVRAQFKVPEPGSDGARLDLDLNYTLLPDVSVTISAPKDVVMAKLPHAVNDPLWFTRTSGASAREEEEEEARDSRIEEGRDEEAPTGTRAPTKVPPPPEKLPAPRRTAAPQ